MDDGADSASGRRGESDRQETEASGDGGAVRQAEPPRSQASADHVSVCQVIPSLGLGGAEQVAVRLANRSAAEFDHSLCYLGVAETLVPDVADDVALYTCGVDSRYDVTAIRPLRRILGAGEFDVVHVHLPMAQSLARLAAGDATVVSTHHNARSLYGFPERYAEWATRFRDDVAVAVSDAVKRSFDSHVAPPTEWRTIYNGIDVEAFRERVQRVRAKSASRGATQPVEPDSVAEHSTEGIPAEADPTDDFSKLDLDGKTVFLNVARYIPAKGQKRLLSAFAELRARHPDVHLLAVGGGPLHAELRKRATALGIADCVTLPGEVPHSDVHRYFAAADAFVLSSESEGLGIVLLEAMAAELPVVTTDFAAGREVVVDGETGYLVDETDLAAGMERLLSANDQPEMGRRGYERVRDRFDVTTMVSEYEALYREIA
jgi:glycosyltransferase involved in cell wall biosynthesis